MTNKNPEQKQNHFSDKEVLRAIFKKDIFQVLHKFDISFESDLAKEFRALIDKINFTIQNDK